MSTSTADAYDSNQKSYSGMIQNVISSAINRRPLGGVPVISPVSVVPSTSSVIGTRNTSKSNWAPAQLTMFYKRLICCWLEMFPTRLRIRHSHSTSHSPGLSSPNSVTSHLGSQSAAGPSCSNNIARVKSIGVLASCNNQPEPYKAVSSVGAPPTTLIPASNLLGLISSLLQFL
ncbi:hypothetical protein Dsin_008950 [Dipteronia sinensis]|uniref:Uncharacterized protein n=1 Tax=Dipteronia sinensis TaxID=43782 RepID=A0AAE0AQI8_9ROSI|nr:hypothetical protein Dsin_008950 [Dipteronia sinensis]